MIKHGVVTDGIQTPAAFAWGVAHAILKERGFPSRLTSSVDGKHSVHSLHYRGLAIDIGIIGVDARIVYDRLYDILHPLGFDVIFERDHIHVEYDPKGHRRLYRFVD